MIKHGINELFEILFPNAQQVETVKFNLICAIQKSFDACIVNLKRELNGLYRKKWKKERKKEKEVETVLN